MEYTKSNQYITTDPQDPSFIGMISGSSIRFYGPQNDGYSHIDFKVNGSGDLVIVNSDNNTHIMDMSTSSVRTFTDSYISGSLHVTNTLRVDGKIEFVQGKDMGTVPLENGIFTVRNPMCFKDSIIFLTKQTFNYPHSNVGISFKDSGVFIISSSDTNDSDLVSYHIYNCYKPLI